MLFRSKIHTLLVKGVKALTLSGLVGTKLTILTMNGYSISSEIIDTKLSIENNQPLAAEFLTEHGCLTILERNERVGMFYGEPIDVNGDNSQQEEGGEIIYSVKIAGVEIINNGLEKLLTKAERDALS